MAVLKVLQALMEQLSNIRFTLEQMLPTQQDLGQTVLEISEAKLDLLQGIEQGEQSDLSSLPAGYFIQETAALDEIFNQITKLNQEQTGPPDLLFLHKDRS